MAKKEVQRLSRADLIEIIYELQKNEERLQAENEALRQKLEAREIKIAEAGSIAEAAVGLSGIFETAQEAADQYLCEVRELRAHAQEEADHQLADAKAQADGMVRRAQIEVAQRWQAFEDRLQQLRQAHSELSFLLEGMSEAQTTHGKTI